MTWIVVTEIFGWKINEWYKISLNLYYKSLSLYLITSLGPLIWIQKSARDTKRNEKQKIGYFENENGLL